MEKPKQGNAAERRFDAFCKAVLYHAAVDYIRKAKQLRRHEVSFDELSAGEQGPLVLCDDYPSDYFVFSFRGLKLCLSSENVASAFASLSEAEQAILILGLVLDLTQEEIGAVLNLPKSTVQWKRAAAIGKLRAALSGKGTL